MFRPRLLDLFCGQGGAGAGYYHSQCIPPAFTQWLGTEMLEALARG